MQSLPVMPIGVLLKDALYRLYHSQGLWRKIWPLGMAWMMFPAWLLLPLGGWQGGLMLAWMFGCMGGVSAFYWDTCRLGYRASLQWTDARLWRHVGKTVAWGMGWLGLVVGVYLVSDSYWWRLTIAGVVFYGVVWRWPWAAYRFWHQLDIEPGAWASLGGPTWNRVPHFLLCVFPALVLATIPSALMVLGSGFIAIILVLQLGILSVLWLIPMAVSAEYSRKHG